MIILGIDPGQNFGWSLCLDGKVIECGLQDFHLKRGESVGIRFIKCQSWLTNLLQDLVSRYGRDKVIVVYEQQHHRGGPATSCGIGFETVILMACTDAKLEYGTIHTSSLKKWGTGNGRAEKADMIKAAQEKTLNPKITDDNIADAVLLSMYGVEKYGH